MNREIVGVLCCTAVGISTVIAGVVLGWSPGDVSRAAAATCAAILTILRSNRPAEGVAGAVGLMAGAEIIGGATWVD